MDRRTFFQRAAIAAAALAIDPEQLLWTPGKKTIFIPPVSGWTSPMLSGEFTICWLIEDKKELDKLCVTSHKL